MRTARGFNHSVVFMLVCTLFSSMIVFGADISVPGDYSTIQAAINAAVSGDVITVSQGTYVENIDFNFKNIILTSTDPEDSTVVAATIIDGGGNGSVVTFRGRETSTCQLSGFTITNGSASSGGGIAGNHSTVTITNCVIINNVATSDWYSAGGGLYGCDGIIRNCLIANNETYEQGGGLCDCSGVIENCTIVGNVSGFADGALGSCRGTIGNCIIWENEDAVIEEDYWEWNNSTPSYCCIENWPGGGTGNINTAPLFVSGPDGEFYLSQIAAGQAVTSPCVDSGSDLASNVGMDAYSTRTDQQADEGTVDMGYHYTSATVVVPDPNLVAHWPLDGEALDASGNGRDGTLVGGPVWSTEGKIGGAIQLDGVDDYVEMVSYKGISGGSSRTCCAWIKTDQLSDEILSWGEDYQGGRWIIRTNEGGQLRAEVQGGNIIGTTLINDNNWHHVAGVLEDDGTPDITEARLYVDGQLEVVSASVDEPVNTGALQNVQIGMYYIGQRYFKGLIDDVRIYDYALSEAEIDDLVGPNLNLSSSEINFVHRSGETGPDDQTLTVQNSGSGTVDWSIDLTDKPDWLTVTPTSGSLGQNESDDVILSVAIEGLAFGLYTYTFEVADPLANNSPQVVNVSLYIGDTLVVPTGYATIQAAIDAAAPGETITVLPGTYVENINFNGKDLILTSTDPEDAEVVAATVIDGDGNGTVVTFGGSETSACQLLGFTITNGYAPSVYTTPGDGGGIVGHGSTATITDCVVSNNTAHRGCGIYQCNGAITRCSIIGNTTVFNTDGGGLYECNGSITDCLIADNMGGGLRYCNGPIHHCMIARNRTVDLEGDHGDGNRGGGLLQCDGTISDCVIIDNYATEDTYASGGGFYDCDGTIRNCLIAYNHSVAGGAGLDSCGGTIENCTIVYNNTGSFIDGGISGCRGIIRNCILWGNEDLDGGELWEWNSSTPSYSCIENWPGGGTGNIDTAPLFISGPDGDFYLSQTTAGQAVASACVDSGSDLASTVGMDSYSTRTDKLTDEGTVDMGYHYPETTTVPFNPADFNGDSNVNLEDFCILASQYNLKVIEPINLSRVSTYTYQWDSALWKTLDYVYWGNPEDVSRAKYALGWDQHKNRIYLQMQVTDHDQVRRDDYGSWDASDRIEVYCQATAEGGTGWPGVYDTAQQYYIGPQLSSNYAAWCSWARGETVGADAKLEYAGRAGGNYLEYGVGVEPFEYYGGFSGGNSTTVDLKPGSVIGFDFTVLTRSATDVGMLSENTLMNKYMDAGQFAKYVLVEDKEYVGRYLQADLDYDNDVDIADLAIFSENWLTGVQPPFSIE